MLHIYKSITLAFFCVEQNTKCITHNNTTSPEWNEKEEEEQKQKGEKEK